MSAEQSLDWKTLMATANGRRAIARLIRECGDGNDVFSAGSPDRTAYQAGRASVVTLIKARLNEVSPTLFYEIQIERIKEEGLTKKNKQVEGQV